MQPLFASKQTLARIDFLRQGGRLVGKKATFYVKILTKNQTKQICCKLARVENGTENMYACNDRRKRLHGMLLIVNGNSCCSSHRSFVR